MKRKKTFVIAGTLIILALITLGGILAGYFNPVSTNAQMNQNPFEEINQLAQENNASPNYSKTKGLASLVVEHLSILEIPSYMASDIADQVATAHLNGASTINESNIVSAINGLADQSSAPAYAYTNVEQVKVVRTFLHSLVPDLVKTSGNMTDLEAFAVFVSTLSQKVDNDAFMVTPSEFTASMSNPANLPFPGSSASVTPVIETSVDSVKTIEMLGVIEGFANSKNMVSSNDMVSMIGIQ